MQRVGVLGASGRLGAAAVAAIAEADDLEAVPLDARGDLDLSGVDVVLDATILAASERIVDAAVAQGVAIVVGTSGWSAARVAALRDRGATGVRIVPNFSIGSVVGTHLATIAARHLGAVEIVETHHAGKVDAPSGTAVRTAEAIAAVRAVDAPTPDAPGRGTLVAGIPVHALRLPGASARQEVVLGGTGETLTIRHDALGHDAYAAGILLALRADRPTGVVVGLDDLLGLA
ncbi:4-hydroxy-tetrahydrodipicolinate reductase [Agrococcus versicolor]|uniref:4-hydroxy-tetrahydrodipicolinate reductase n=1 Tax=Agrococcus versicolor TaxID=501482 RepID=A0ABN3ATJ3_9MICO